MRDKKIKNLRKRFPNEYIVDVKVRRLFMFPKDIFSIEQIKSYFDDYSLRQYHASRDYHRLTEDTKKYKIY